MWIRCAQGEAPTLPMLTYSTILHEAHSKIWIVGFEETTDPTLDT